MMTINRRQFCKVGAGSAAIATCLPKFALSQPRAVPRQFPKDFVWGCSTASYQIEGAVKEDGRVLAHAWQDRQRRYRGCGR